MVGWIPFGPLNLSEQAVPPTLEIHTPSLCQRRGGFVHVWVLLDTCEQEPDGLPLLPQTHTLDVARQKTEQEDGAFLLWSKEVNGQRQVCREIWGRCLEIAEKREYVHMGKFLCKRLQIEPQPYASLCSFTRILIQTFRKSSRLCGCPSLPKEVWQLRFKEAKPLTHGHVEGQWPRRDSNSLLFFSPPVLVSF